jgi:hypothetical protein
LFVILAKYEFAYNSHQFIFGGSIEDSLSQPGKKTLRGWCRADLDY